MKIVTESSLKHYFYSKLDELNKKSLCPVPQETIFYSSNMLEKFSLTEKLFEIREGRMSEKILGEKLLKAGSLSSNEQKREYQDIGDTALFVCGYFRKSLSQKLNDISYYYKLGKTAYCKLDSVKGAHLEIPDLYNVLATCFENVAVLMSSLALNDLSDPQSHLLLDSIKDETLTEKDLMTRGIFKGTDKVS
jgi:hypothetical protein